MNARPRARNSHGSHPCSSGAPQSMRMWRLCERRLVVFHPRTWERWGQRLPPSKAAIIVGAFHAGLGSAFGKEQRPDKGGTSGGFWGTPNLHLTASLCKEGEHHFRRSSAGAQGTANHGPREGVTQRQLLST